MGSKLPAATRAPFELVAIARKCSALRLALGLRTEREMQEPQPVFATRHHWILEQGLRNPTPRKHGHVC